MMNTVVEVFVVMLFATSLGAVAGLILALTTVVWKWIRGKV